MCFCVALGQGLHQDPDHSEEEEEVVEKSSSLDKEDRPFDKRTMSNGSASNDS